MVKNHVTSDFKCRTQCVSGKTIEPRESPVTYLPVNVPANANDSPSSQLTRNPRILSWLARLAEPDLALDALTENPFETAPKAATDSAASSADWQTITSLCAYTAGDFAHAGAALPLTAAEADYFRRNHRSTENRVSRDFLAGRIDLPSPLAELYGLYLFRARVDVEAALFVAQATGSTRVARAMADLLAIGAFAGGLEYVTHLGLTYSVPTAFDTSALIDHANDEVARRLALPADHSAHLLRMTPDEIGALAATLTNGYGLPPAAFLEKANLLAEARQDVTRLPTAEQIGTALSDHDLPANRGWVMRLRTAYERVLPQWVDRLHTTNVSAH